MLNKIRHYWKKAVHLGIPFPHAYDPVEKLPSFRLFGAYVSFVVAVGSVLWLHYDASAIAGSVAAISLYALCMTFYLIKKLTGAKIDFSAKKLELNNDKKSES